MKVRWHAPELDLDQNFDPTADPAKTTIIIKHPDGSTADVYQTASSVHPDGTPYLTIVLKFNAQKGN